MRNLLFSLACLGLVAAYVAPAAAATDNLTVKLTAQNGSGEDGDATLTQSGSDVTVVVVIPKAPAGPQPMHIHTGTCANLGGVAYPLTSLSNGKSTTKVSNVTIDKLIAGTFAINVHKSADALGVYVSCGDIVKPSSM